MNDTIPTGEGYVTLSETEYKELQAELARVTAERDDADRRKNYWCDKYETVTEQLRADLARVTAERDAAKNNVEAYLNERVCCSGEACGCGGITRLQQLVHEEAGATIDRLATEASALRDRVADFERMNAGLDKRCSDLALDKLTAEQRVAELEEIAKKEIEHSRHYSTRLSEQNTRVDKLKAALNEAAQTIKAIRAVNVTEFGTVADAAIDRLCLSDNTESLLARAESATPKEVQP